MYKIIWYVYNVCKYVCTIHFVHYVYNMYEHVYTFYEWICPYISHMRMNIFSFINYAYLQLHVHL